MLGPLTPTTTSAEVGEQREPAVDEQRLAGDVAGVVRQQERGDRGHLLGVAGTAPSGCGDSTSCPLLGVVDPGPVDRRDGGAGADGVDPDAAAGVLERERAGQVLHAALAHRIAEEPRLGDELVHRRDVDDRPGLVLGERGGGGPAARTGTTRAGSPRAPCRRRPRRARRESAAIWMPALLTRKSTVPSSAATCLNMASTSASRRRRRPRPGRAWRRPSSHLLHARFTPPSIAALVSSAPSGRPDVVDGDVDAFLAELDGDCLADARAATGDEGRLATQTVHRNSFGIGMRSA